MNTNQCQLILHHLKTYGSISPLEAISEYGIQRLAARISDLRAMGYTIVAETKTGKNRYGKPTHFAVYRLKEEII